MKHLIARAALALVLALGAPGLGCSSNPTPYPGQPDGKAADESLNLDDGAASPDPNADQETCERFGGSWDGDACFGAVVPGGDVVGGDADADDAEDAGDAEDAEAPDGVEPGPTDTFSPF